VIEIDHPSALRDLVGRELAISDWITITQERIDAFAAATEDHQWIHVDAGRASEEGPFGGTIAHGFLTLSLMSPLLRNAVSVRGLRMAINYGLNRVRFVSPVPAGARVRARVALSAVTTVREGLQAEWHVTVEREDHDKPCMVADWLVRYL
jgi:acyl dehydratase